MGKKELAPAANCKATGLATRESGELLKLSAFKSNCIVTLPVSTINFCNVAVASAELPWPVRLAKFAAVLPKSRSDGSAKIVRIFLNMVCGSFRVMVGFFLRSVKENLAFSHQGGRRVNEFPLWLWCGVPLRLLRIMGLAAATESVAIEAWGWRGVSG